MLRTRTSRARVPFAALLLATTLLVSACGPLRRTPDAERTVVTFRNESTTQVDLYAVTQTGSFRLGTVSPNRTVDLTLSPTVVGAGTSGVNFVARLFPSRATVESGNVTITRGDRLEVRLPPTLNFLVVTPG